jgi:hypothetical protein
MPFFTFQYVSPTGSSLTPTAPFSCFTQSCGGCGNIVFAMTEGSSAVPWHTSHLSS